MFYHNHLRPKVFEYREKVHVLPYTFNLALLHYELHQRVVVVRLAFLWGACRTLAIDMDFSHTSFTFHSYSKFIDRQCRESAKERGKLLAESFLVRCGSSQGDLRFETRKEESAVGRTQGEQLGEFTRSEVANKFMDNGASVFWVSLRYRSLKNRRICTSFILGRKPISRTPTAAPSGCKTALAIAPTARRLTENAVARKRMPVTNYGRLDTDIERI